MEILIALVFFGVTLGLIIFFGEQLVAEQLVAEQLVAEQLVAEQLVAEQLVAEQLVKGLVGTSVGFGLSTFLLSVLFIGFDPDNLAVGTVASAEGMSGIALARSPLL